jgi:protein TonB
MRALSPTRSPVDWRRSGSASKWTSALAVIGLHVALVAVLLQFDAVRTAVTTAAPVMVTLMPPPREKPKETPKPPPPPPKREVRHKPRPAPAPPIITAQPEAPSTYTAPPPTPEPLPPIEAPVAPVAAAPAPEPAPPPPPVTPPRFNAAYLNNPPPAYPLESRQTGEQGRVVLRVFVNESGLPQEIQVRTSSGFSRLDNTAQETVRRWKFVPARRGDTAVGAWVLVPMTFRLSN